MTTPIFLCALCGTSYVMDGQIVPHKCESSNIPHSHATEANMAVDTLLSLPADALVDVPKAKIDKVRERLTNIVQWMKAQEWADEARAKLDEKGG